MHRVINYFLAPTHFILLFLATFSQPSLLGMEPETVPLQNTDKAIGAILAFQKKLFGTGTIKFEDGSKIESFFGMPIGAVVLITQSTLSSNDYTYKQKVAIFFNLMGADQFQAKRNSLMNYLCDCDPPESIFGAICSRPLQMALDKSYEQKIIDLNVKKVISSIQHLLQNGASFSAEEKNGKTHLIEVSKQGDRSLELAKFMIQQGADPNSRKKNGRTPLMEAATQGDSAERLITYLLSVRANPNLTMKGGKTALDIAQEKKAVKITPLLSKGLT